jgi:transposase InsO family protein
MPEAIVVAALRTAIKESQPAPNLTHHSDRGGHHVGNEYRAVMQGAQLRDCGLFAFRESR